MKRTRLGRTGLTSPGWGSEASQYRGASWTEAVTVINRALGLGVNLIDTSIGYGNSEIRIGKAIAKRRDDVVLATKGRWHDK